MLTRKQILDRYYPEVRAWLIQIAAVMDRYDRAADDPAAPAGEDERLRLYREALKVLAEEEGTADRARKVQMIYSDPAGEPVET